MRGRWILLRPVEREDFRTFFAWRSDLTEAYLWTTQARRVVTFEQFIPEFERLLHDSIALLVADTETNQVLGFVRAYNLNFVDGVVFAQGFVAPAYRLRPHVWECAALFADYLFRYYPIRKLYAEVASYNKYAERIYARIGFKRQARLTEHLWYAHRYWDWLIYSLSRDDWLEARARVQVLLQVEHDMDEIGTKGATALKQEAFA